MRTTFKLDKNFVAQYKERRPNWGFGGLGELTFYRTYSRLKPDGTNEDWTDCVERVINGTYSIQKRHITKYGLGWEEDKAQRSAQEMFDRMWNFKFLPPGRGLWAMGTDIIEKRELFAALNNCAFTSTEYIAKEGSKPFEFLMDMSMLGVGVGFDDKGAGTLLVKAPKGEKNFAIPDSREGWVEALGLLLNAYFKGQELPIFDYSLIREAGLPIKTFGGTSSGPEPLRELLEAINDLLKERVNFAITVRDITDIMNLIGVCVIAGNVRRTAEISFGEPTEEYMDLKNYAVNPERAAFGWTSNNSIFCTVGMDYGPACKRTAINGEPGFEWLKNAQDYGRMVDPPNFKDRKAKGGNPCLEQTLEDKELCCLVETFPIFHTDLEDYKRTLKFAYLYAKTVTLGNTHWVDTNRVMMRNRRIGLSQSGIAMFVEEHGLETYREWCEAGYANIQEWDEVYSEWLAIPRSIKTTSVKPSGTVSLLAGVSPGMHWIENRWYKRRIRVGSTSSLVQACIDAGYHAEPDVYDSSSMVITIPVAVDRKVRTVDEVSMWEQVAMAAFIQRYWADNQVSCTVTFQPWEGPQIEQALNHFQYHLKGISFLPKTEEGAYKQMPYESITEAEYEDLMRGVKPLNFTGLAEDSTAEKFCNNDTCEI